MKLGETHRILVVNIFARYNYEKRAQINWRIISRKVLFDPHRFLSNKSPIHFPGESGKGNTFLNGKWHVQNENGPQSPQSQT